MQCKAIFKKYDNTHTKIIKLQEDYILLVKDIELSLKIYIWTILYPKFKGKLYEENAIVLTSRKRLNSTIYIDENETSAIFEKNSNLKENYTEN